MQNYSKSYIRQPAVAGLFYDAHSFQLDQKIQKLLDSVKPDSGFQNPAILISPHAGLDYSGQTAAYAFCQLSNQKFTKIILTGASHTTYLDYIAVSPKGIWQTPLGSSSTEDDLIDYAVYSNDFFRIDPGPHKEEHSLEMELLFLQKTLPEVKILPLIFGQLSEKQLDKAAGTISEMIDDRTLLVASSDLSHYPDWHTAVEADKTVIDAIVKADPVSFRKRLKDLEASGFTNLQTAACGQDVIYVALKVAKILGINNPKLLDYKNSGDITGDKSRVVGYASIGLFKDNNYQLPVGVKQEALNIARQSIVAYLNQSDAKKAVPTAGFLKSKKGVFITLHNDGQLRGCIGQFEPSTPLYQTIADVAVESAVKDPRFESVTIDKLSQIQIEISILSEPQPIKDISQIIPGKHGVIIEKAGCKATFLPQVASDFKWNRRELLENLCREKAGLDENCYLDPDTKLYVYTAIAFSESKHDFR